jgi:hypothetical protein
LKILLLIGFFDSFLFPRADLYEDQFNPAQLHQKKTEVILTSEVRFGLAELCTFCAYSQIDRYSLEVASFGNENYRENFLQFGFGFPVMEKIALGMSVAGMNVRITDINNEFIYGLRAGARFESGPFLIGAWANNFNIPRLSSVDYIPVSYSLRFDYQAASTVDFRFALCGKGRELPFYNFGLAFTPHRSLLLTLGANTKPILLEYGLRFSVGKMFLNYSGKRHQQLGLTHILGLGFTQ